MSYGNSAVLTRTNEPLMALKLHMYGNQHDKNTILPEGVTRHGGFSIYVKAMWAGERSVGQEEGC